MKTGILLVFLLGIFLALPLQQDDVLNGDYDAIINIDSFKNLIEDKVKIVYKNDTILSMLENPNHRVSSIGVLGLRNKGKTFILNLFTNKTLPSGFEINTEGISILTKIEQETSFQLFLDSKGLSQPSQIDWNTLNLYSNSKEVQKGIKDSLIEINLIEKIQHDIIFDLSQILIIMVDNLELSDQKLIEQVLLRNSEKKEGKKTIFVIHNMKYVKTKIELDKQIERIKKQFCLMQQKPYIFHDNRSTLKNQLDKVFHLFFAQDNSEAGNLVNSITLNRIRIVIEIQDQNLKFHQQLEISLSNAVKQYSRITFNQIAKYPKETIYQMKDVNCTGVASEMVIKKSINITNEIKCRSFQLINNFTITQQNSLIQDEIGIFKTEIVYEIIKISEKSFKIIVDIPGNQTCKYYIEHETDTLILTNKRSSAYQSDSCQKDEIQKCNDSESFEPFVVFQNFSIQEVQYSIELPKLMKKSYQFYSIQKNDKEEKGLIEFCVQINSNDDFN